MDDPIQSNLTGPLTPNHANISYDLYWRVEDLRDIMINPSDYNLVSVLNLLNFWRDKPWIR